MAIYSEFSHWKWWFSIVMLVYQRVPPRNYLELRLCNLCNYFLVQLHFQEFIYRAQQNTQVATKCHALAM